MINQIYPGRFGAPDLLLTSSQINFNASAGDKHTFAIPSAPLGYEISAVYLHNFSAAVSGVVRFALRTGASGTGTALYTFGPSLDADIAGFGSLIYKVNKVPQTASDILPDGGNAEVTFNTWLTAQSLYLNLIAPNGAALLGYMSVRLLIL